VRAFLDPLDRYHHLNVKNLEIEVRKVHSDHPALARKWVQYLAWEDLPGGKSRDSLREDAPGLKTLRLNFEPWPRISMFRAVSKSSHTKCMGDMY